MGFKTSSCKLCIIFLFVKSISLPQIHHR